MVTAAAFQSSTYSSDAETPPVMTSATRIPVATGQLTAAAECAGGSAAGLIPTIPSRRQARPTRDSVHRRARSIATSRRGSWAGDVVVADAAHLPLIWAWQAASTRRSTWCDQLALGAGLRPTGPSTTCRRDRGP